MKERDSKCEIAARIKLARQELGMSQIELAERIGVARQTYLNLEGGDTDPKVFMLNRIADATGCDRLWLFGLENECQCGLNPHVKAAIRAYHLSIKKANNRDRRRRCPK